jgi:hypothetical protein
MRRIIAIFFLLIFSASYTEAAQVFKLPLLLQHYHKHLHKEKAITFTRFLEEHYLYDHKDDGDKDDDNNLPFKIPNINIASSFDFHGPVFQSKSPAPGFISERSLYKHPYILTQHCFSIFHPPRLS